MNSDKNGLINSYILDGMGHGRSANWGDINNWQTDQGVLWINLDYADISARQWLENNSKLDPVIISSLLAEHSSPRCFLTSDGVLLNLRGVNFTPGPESTDEDMVSIRIWIQENRIISVQRHHLFSVDELIRNIEQGVGPRTTGEFVVDLTNEILEKMSTIIGVLEKKIDTIQDMLDDKEPPLIRRKLSMCRRRIVTMRRYMHPQRDALLRMQTDRIPWLNDLDRVHLREVADRTNRYIEDLDAARDRATIVQEELISRTSEQISNKIYVLSLVAVIFMPLSFLAALLGANVGGIPGSDSPWGFSILCAVAVVAFFVEWRILRRVKWL